MKTNGKSTKVEVELRIMQVYTMIVNAWSKIEIVRYCSEKFNVCERQAEEYMERAHEKLKEIHKEASKNVLEKSIQRYEKWLKKSEEQGDYKGAKDMQIRIDKLLGLEKENIDITGNIKLVSFQETAKSIYDAINKKTD
jgi:predicted DNA-binding protein (UPF0278 family)